MKFTRIFLLLSIAIFSVFAYDLPIETLNQYSGIVFNIFPNFTKPHLNIPSDCKEIKRFQGNSCVTLTQKNKGDTTYYSGYSMEPYLPYDSISILYTDNVFHYKTTTPTSSSYDKTIYSFISNNLTDTILYTRNINDSRDDLSVLEHWINYKSNSNILKIDSTVFFREYSRRLVTPSNTGTYIKQNIKAAFYPVYNNNNQIIKILRIQEISNHSTDIHIGIYETNTKDTIIDSCIYLYNYDDAKRLITSEHINFHIKKSEIYFDSTIFENDTTFHKVIKDTSTTYPLLKSHYKFSFIYNNNSNCLNEENFYKYNFTSNTFILNKRKVHIYNQDNLLSEVKSIYYPSDGKDSLSSSAYFRYNEKGQFTNITYHLDSWGSPIQTFFYGTRISDQPYKSKNTHIAVQTKQQSGNLIINFNLPFPTPVNIEIYSLSGRRIKTICKNKKFNSGKPSLSYQLSNISSGAYIVSIETEFGKFNKTIMVK